MLIYPHIYPGVCRSCILLLLMPLLGLTVDYVCVYEALSVWILSMSSIDGCGPQTQLLMDLIFFVVVVIVVFFFLFLFLGVERSLRTVLVICFLTAQGDFLVRFLSFHVSSVTSFSSILPLNCCPSFLFCRENRQKSKEGFLWLLYLPRWP